jgi:hypothetical protein
LLNTSLKTDKKGRNMYEADHTLHITVYNYNAVVGMCVCVFMCVCIVTYLTAWAINNFKVLHSVHNKYSPNLQLFLEAYYLHSIKMVSPNG